MYSKNVLWLDCPSFPGQEADVRRVLVKVGRPVHHEVFLASGVGARGKSPGCQGILGGVGHDLRGSFHGCLEAPDCGWYRGNSVTQSDYRIPSNSFHVIVVVSSGITSHCYLITADFSHEKMENKDRNI